VKNALGTPAVVFALLGFFLGVFMATLMGPLEFPTLSSNGPIAANSTSIQSVFSPGSQPAIMREIDSANHSLDIMLYQFSLADYQAALGRAVQRGVSVRIIFEPRVNSNFKTADYLRSHGVSVRWASLEYTNTHSKTMVADGRRVLVGSINWSRNAAKTNRESAVIIDDARVAGEFEGVFESDWAKATQGNPSATPTPSAK